MSRSYTCEVLVDCSGPVQFGPNPATGAIELSVDNCLLLSGSCPPRMTTFITALHAAGEEGVSDEAAAEDIDTSLQMVRQLVSDLKSSLVTRIRQVFRPDAQSSLAQELASWCAPNRTSWRVQFRIRDQVVVSIVRERQQGTMVTRLWETNSARGDQTTIRSDDAGSIAEVVSRIALSEHGTDPQFVDTGLVAELTSSLLESRGTIVVHGAGGAGKSTLARELLHASEIRAQFPYRFFIRAATKPQLYESLATTAAILVGKGLLEPPKFSWATKPGAPTDPQVPCFGVDGMAG